MLSYSCVTGRRILANNSAHGNRILAQARGTETHSDWRSFRTAPVFTGAFCSIHAVRPRTQPPMLVINPPLAPSPVPPAESSLRPAPPPALRVLLFPSPAWLLYPNVSEDMSAWHVEPSLSFRLQLSRRVPNALEKCARHLHRSCCRAPEKFRLSHAL